jgi:hypothetical protein
VGQDLSTEGSPSWEDSMLIDLIRSMRKDRKEKSRKEVGSKGGKGKA